MKKKLNNFLLTYLILGCLFCAGLGVQATEQNEFGTMQPAEKKTEPFPFKEKLLTVTLGVGASIVVIYLGLLAYKRLFKIKLSTGSKTDFSENLESPANISDAMNIFLSKSK